MQAHLILLLCNWTRQDELQQWTTYMLTSIWCHQITVIPSCLITSLDPSVSVLKTSSSLNIWNHSIMVKMGNYCIKVFLSPCPPSCLYTLCPNPHCVPQAISWHQSTKITLIPATDTEAVLAQTTLDKSLSKIVTFRQSASSFPLSL